MIRKPPLFQISVVRDFLAALSNQYRFVIVMEWVSLWLHVSSSYMVHHGVNLFIIVMHNSLKFSKASSGRMQHISQNNPSSPSAVAITDTISDAVVGRSCWRVMTISESIQYRVVGLSTGFFEFRNQPLEPGRICADILRSKPVPIHALRRKS